MMKGMSNPTDDESPVGQYNELVNGSRPNIRNSVHCGRCYKYCRNKESSKNRCFGLFLTILGGADLWFNYCLYSNDPVVAFLDLKNTTDPINEGAAGLGMAIGAGVILGGLCLAAGFCTKSSQISEAAKE